MSLIKDIEKKHKKAKSKAILEGILTYLREMLKPDKK